MKTFYYILISFIFLFGFINNIYSVTLNDFNYNITINNETVSISEGCNLTLKPNDIVKISGVTEPNKLITVSLFNENYEVTSDVTGNWMFLYSIPYVEDGEYEIRGKQELNEDDYLLCRITLNESTNNSENQTDKSSSLIPYLFIILIGIAVLVYIFLIIRKKSK